MVVGIIAAVALAFITGVFVGGMIISKDTYDEEAEEPLGLRVWGDLTKLFQT